MTKRDATDKLRIRTKTGILKCRFPNTTQVGPNVRLAEVLTTIHERLCRIEDYLAQEDEK